MIGGKVALKLDPNLLAELAKNRRSVVVSGTNGKSTTTRLLRAALFSIGHVASNTNGDNMTPGITTALMRSDAPLAALEVDEMHMPTVSRFVDPQAMVLLNLSRDQLDRVGEIGAVERRLRKAVNEHPNAVVIANCDDPLVASAAWDSPNVHWVAAGHAWMGDSTAFPRGGRVIHSDDSWRVVPLTASSSDEGLDQYRRPDPLWWLEDEDLFSRTYPMDLRPQGQDIIRTWLFSTVVRADLEFGALPWAHAGLSGWILDSDHKKMSKSKGNVVTPMGLLEKFGSDAVRYWAASARLGLDAAFDESQMKIGRRLAIKVLNASKFALTMGGDADLDLDITHVVQPLDRSMLAGLREVVASATTALKNYEHARTLEVTESFFWTFCDDYLELVKERAYNREGKWSDQASASARAALAIAIDTFVRLLAPYLPFVTEEVWSWYREGSVHQAAWPTTSNLEVTPDGSIEGAIEDASSVLLGVASEALVVLRRVKSEAKVSPRTPFLEVTVSAPEQMIPLLEEVLEDLAAATKIQGPAHFEASADSTEDEGAIRVASFELGEAPAKKKN